jgi:hypothetical protein
MASLAQALTQALDASFPRMAFAMAYGSGVFQQKNHDASTSMIDPALPRRGERGGFPGMTLSLQSWWACAERWRCRRTMAPESTTTRWYATTAMLTLVDATSSS